MPSSATNMLRVTWLLSLLATCSPLSAGFEQLVRRPAPPLALRACRAGAVVCRAKKEDDWARALDDEPIRVGSVVLSTEGSVDHYFHQSLVLVLEHSDDAGTRGVILNNPSPWTVSDMGASLESLGENTVYLGGDAGSDTMVMVHGLHLVKGSAPIGEEAVGAALGGAGLYLGGVKDAVELVEAGQLSPDKFKFFYKSVEWLPKQLERQRAEGMFRHVSLSPSLLLGDASRSMWERVSDLLRHDEAGGRRGDGGESEGEAAVAPSSAWAASAAAKDAEAAKEAEAEEKLGQSEREAANAAMEALLQKGVERARTAVGLPSEPPSGADAAATAAESGGTSGGLKSSGRRVGEVIEYRDFKGLEQWRVRWEGRGAEDDSWEVMSVLDSDEARARAAELRDRAR